MTLGVTRHLSYCCLCQMTSVQRPLPPCDPSKSPSSNAALAPPAVAPLNYCNCPCLVAMTTSTVVVLLSKCALQKHVACFQLVTLTVLCEWNFIFHSILFFKKCLMVTKKPTATNCHHCCQYLYLLTLINDAIK